MGNWKFAGEILADKGGWLALNWEFVFQ